MPVSKLKASGTPYVMKPSEGNDSLDTVIRQAIGKEPFLSFSKAGDNPVQWILHALDQPAPFKVELQKCDKCSREFCSSINYRRHIRVHHRLKNLDKDSKKNRDLLGAYWDKLSVEEAKEVVSFENVMLEDVPGSSVLKSLTTFLREQGFSLLPQYYLRAGSALLDIVQSRPFTFPLSSLELFSILDDSSEKTFLCGTAVSMQRYIFDGEAGKIGLESKNLVACTSFLLELKLVRAWLADKDAEALRCQKLLVEEEEAAQRRQAEILERKRQKKLRQKEQKVRERHEGDTITGNIDSTAQSLSPAKAYLETCNSEAHNPDAILDHDPSSHVTQCPDYDESADGNTLLGYDCDNYLDIGRPYHRMVDARQQGLPKSQWTVANGLYANQNSQMSKVGIIQKYDAHCDCRDASVINYSKVWSQKPKPEIDGVALKARREKVVQGKNREVLIGSIRVSLGNCSHSDGNLVASQGDCMVENLVRQNCAEEMPVKPNSFQGDKNQLTDMLWRPVDQHGTNDPLPLQSAVTEADAVYGKGDGQNLSGRSCLKLCNIDGSEIGIGSHCFHVEDKVNSGSLRLSSHAAKAFLAQRWKAAISSNHVKLVVSPDSDRPGRHEVQDCELSMH